MWGTTFCGWRGRGSSMVGPYWDNSICSPSFMLIRSAPPGMRSPSSSLPCEPSVMAASVIAHIHLSLIPWVLFLAAELVSWTQNDSRSASYGWQDMIHCIRLWQSVCLAGRFLSLPNQMEPITKELCLPPPPQCTMEETSPVISSIISSMLSE